MSYFKKRMKKVVIILIVLVCNLTLIFSQDIKFKWSVNPSLGGVRHVVEVVKLNSKCYFQIKNTFTKETLKKKITIDEFNSFDNFLSNYDFPRRGGEYCDTIQTFFETKILPDTNWVSVNGDSLRIKQMPYYVEKSKYHEKTTDGFYEYDRASKKCYTIILKCNSITDGTTYKGEYIKNDFVKNYSLQSSRLSTTDYKLNKIVLALVKKYDVKGDLYKQLIFIEKDTPIPDKYLNNKKLRRKENY